MSKFFYISFSTFISNHQSDTGQTPVKERINSAITFCYFCAAIICAILALTNAATKNSWEWYPLAIGSAISLGSLFHFLATRDHKPTALLLSVSALLLTLLLSVSGSPDSIAPIWALLLPSIIFTATGLKTGFTLLGSYFLIISWLSIAQVSPETQPIQFRQAIEFLFMLACAILFAGFIEYTHGIMLKHLDTLTTLLQQQANQDPLTELANRRSMYELIERERSRATRTCEPYSLIIVDIDDFKVINDTLGHAAGDKAITHCAEILKQQLRLEDYISRWGGEEFLVMLPNTGYTQAMTVSERVRQAIANSTTRAGDHTLEMTASFGVYTSDLSDTIHNDIHQADTCLYEAKRQGKNMTVGKDAGLIAPQAYQTQVEDAIICRPVFPHTEVLLNRHFE